MNDRAPQLQLVFSSTDKFCRWFDRLKQGDVFLRMKQPLPEGTKLTLALGIPHLQKTIKVTGVVSESRRSVEGNSGIKVDFQNQEKKLVPAMEKLLSRYPEYCQKLDLSPPPSTDESRKTPPAGIKATKEEKRQPEEASLAHEPVGEAASTAESMKEPTSAADLSLDWLYEAVTQPEKARAVKEVEPQLMETSTLNEKMRLTAEERALLEPVGVFVRNLTKAMLKSGYYAPDHPGGQGAKQGLYEEFKTVVGETAEIMITNREARDKSEILISGVVDEPVSIVLLVGESTADLFAPKLQEYCRRKRLVSFAIKRDITIDHFEAFVDIVSDPKVDTVADKEVGAYLTNALVENGITEISTVFLDDFISLETDLPWRVEMAIQRLTKDLHVLPLMKNLDEAQFKKTKQNIVEDIIRPLQHPRLLNDLLVNCYIIARHIEDMETEEIEQIVVEAFQPGMLMSTVNLTFEEFDRLQAQKKETPDNRILDRRIAGIKRILRLIAARMVDEDAGASEEFIATLYEKGLMRFEDLPESVQYVLNTRRIANDVRNNCQRYLTGIVSAENPKEVQIYLKSFRRIIPVLVEENEWVLLLEVAEAVQKAGENKQVVTAERIKEIVAAQDNEVVQDAAAHQIFLNSIENPAQAAVIYIFKEVSQPLMGRYGQMIAGPEELTAHRQQLENIFKILGPLGVDILARILLQGENNAVAQAAMDLMVSHGALARDWALQQFDENAEHPSKFYYSLMYVLGRVGEGPEDFKPVRPFLKSADIQLRQAAMEAATWLHPADMETMLVECLTDDDEKIRSLAIRLLGHFVAPVSEDALERILTFMGLDPENVPDPEAHLVLLERLLTALTEMQELPLQERIEPKVISLFKRFDKKTSRFKRFLPKKGHDRSATVTKILRLLVRVGGPASEEFLYSLIRSKSPHAEQILAALEEMGKKPKRAATGSKSAR